MGLSYQVIEAKGPTFEQTVRSKSDIEKLRVAGPEHLSYVLEAIRITKRELHDRVPLIGFAGAPWTILAYMVEGKGSKTFSVAKKFLYTEPALAHALLEKITESTIQYLKAQIAAGANLVQLFDSWAGLLSPDQYREFSLRYLEAIAAAITEVPVTIFAKGAFFARKEIAATNCSVIGLDWNMDIQESRALIGDAKTLQGNMDPCLLYAEDSVIVHETHRMLEAFGPFRHIANLGHGLYPDTDPRKVKLFIDTVKNFRFKV
jgi:uroporphyrinogen decarboxylase